MPDHAKPILIVEDDEDIRDGLRDLLESEGYRVITAAGAREGLDRLADSAPALVLLDLMMPVMDGFGFLEVARGRGSRFSDVPVVVITAAPPSVAARARADDVIAKPIDVEALLRAVAKYCC